MIFCWKVSKTWIIGEDFVGLWWSAPNWWLLKRCHASLARGIYLKNWAADDCWKSDEKSVKKIQHNICGSGQEGCWGSSWLLVFGDKLLNLGFGSAFTRSRTHTVLASSVKVSRSLTTYLPTSTYKSPLVFVGDPCEGVWRPLGCLLALAPGLWHTIPAHLFTDIVYYAAVLVYWYSVIYYCTGMLV